MGRIYEARASGRVYGIDVRAVIGAVFDIAGQIKGGAALPCLHDGFAGLVGVDLAGRRGWLDRRDLQVLALLNIENCVIGQNKGGAVAPFCGGVGLRVLGVAGRKLLVRTICLPLSPFRTLPLRSRACLNVSQNGER